MPDNDLYTKIYDLVCSRISDIDFDETARVSMARDVVDALWASCVTKTMTENGSTDKAPLLFHKLASDLFDV